MVQPPSLIFPFSPNPTCCLITFISNPSHIAISHRTHFIIFHPFLRRIALVNHCTGTARLVAGIDCVTAGVVSFVVQEEFDRYTGFWWRPQPKASQGNHYTRSGSAMHLDSTDEVGDES